MWNGPSGFVFNGQQPGVFVAGTYTVKVTDAAGCTGTASTAVTQYPAPVAQLSVADASLCSGETATFMAEGGVQYQLWQDGQKVGSLLWLSGPFHK